MLFCVGERVVQEAARGTRKKITLPFPGMTETVEVDIPPGASSPP